MKSGFSPLLIAIVLYGLAANVFASGLKSQIIAAGDHLDITVADGVFLKVRNFTQEGGTNRGVVTVTIASQTANVLSAARIDSSALEPINSVIIAGPATVTVTAAADVAVFITYKKEKDSE